MPPSDPPEERRGGRAFLEGAEARARKELWSRADHIVRDNPEWSSEVAAYLAEPIGPKPDAPGPIDEVLRTARIELATVRELLGSLGHSTPLREALLHELTRTNTMHGIAAELRRLGDEDARLDEVSMRLDALNRLRDEWVD